MAATLGIIKLDSDFARFPGDPGNPATFDVPVLYETLSGATAERVTGPGVATCGSGVTACILSLALQIIKVEPCPIYDGSWEQWGMREDLPTERPEARSGGPASAPRQRLHP